RGVLSPISFETRNAKSSKAVYPLTEAPMYVRTCICVSAEEFDERRPFKNLKFYAKKDEWPRK
ncbi:MAG: hypothetical protein ACOYU3_04900, partial [Bacillota bacterium]